MVVWVQEAALTLPSEDKIRSRENLHTVCCEAALEENRELKAQGGHGDGSIM